MTTCNGFIRLSYMGVAFQKITFSSASSTQQNLISGVNEKTKDKNTLLSSGFRYSNILRSSEAISSDEIQNVTKCSREQVAVSEDLIEQERIQLNLSGKKRKLQKFSINTQGEIIYGVHPVHLALHCRRREPFQLYMYQKLPRPLDGMKGKIYQQALDLGIPIKEVSRKALLKISEGHVNQGVCLDASHLTMLDTAESFVENTSMKNNSFCLLLDRIQDPMNFGAVLRSSYYFGVDRVFAVKESSCKLSPVVSKASSGAMEVLPVYAVNDLKSFLQSKKEEGWMIIGSDACSSSHKQRVIEINEVDITRPTIFILGNEGTGMSECIYDFLDSTVAIKPKKKLDPDIGSLNVSVACGIVLHQLVGRCRFLS